MENLLNQVLGWPGHIVSGSKSCYRENNPGNLVIFNSNVCTDEGKIWWGDIDITLSKDELSEIAIAEGKTIYVLYEMDGRFENEDSPKLNQAVVRFLPDGLVIIREDLQKYYSI
jgi:hypothetical protein